MTKNKTNPQPATIPAAGKTLRQQAEDALKKLHLDRGPVAPEDAKLLNHELEVHQIELEMQNEDLRRIHMELDAARARYFDLYDLAPVGYCTVSEQGLLLEANLTAKTLLGVARHQRAGQQIFSRLIHTDDQGIYYFHRKKLFVTGEPQECELRMVKKDGAAFWAHMKATVAQDENGAPVARIVLNDITLRKQEEEALRHSEEKYRTLFTGMSQGAFYQAADGRLLDVNPAALRIFGLTRQEFLERTSHSPAWKVIREDGSEVPPEEHPSMAPLKIGIQIKDLTLGVFNQITNSYVWVIVNATPQYLPGENSPFQVYLTLHDITQRKQAEEALKNSEYRQKALLNNIPDIAWIKDIEGKYIAVNEAYEKAAVCLQEEIIGKNDEDLWPAGCAAQYRKNDIQVMQSGKRIAVEENMIDHDGAAKVMEAIRTPLYDNKGDLIGTVGIARDVTERVKAAEMLRMASQKWRDTFDAMSDSVALLSVDGRIEQCNRALIDYLGLDFPAVLGQKCHRLIHQTNDHMSGCPTVKALASGVRETIELQAGEKFFLVVADPIKAPDGKITGFVHIMSDITERRQGENALQANEKLLSDARQAAHMGTRLFDVATGEMRWSDEINHILGLPVAAGMMYGEFVEYLHPDDCASFIEAWYSPSLEHPSFKLEYRIVRPSGEIRHIQETTINMYDDSGNVVNVASIVLDITESKLVKLELEKSEERYRRITATVTDYIYTVFMENGRAVRTVHGPACVAITGYSPEELDADPNLWLTMVLPEDREFVKEHASHILAETNPRAIEHRMRRKDGAVRWVVNTPALHRDSTGALISYDGIICDITERKEAEQALQAKNAELERFTYSVSHDLRSPLVTIRTFVGHLMQDMARGDKESVAQDFDYINGASKKMVELLDELLKLSRIGRMANPYVEVPLQDLVSEALIMVAGRIDERAARVTVTEKSFLLYGDRVRLVEVFQNLVDNAVKFMGEQKEPLVEIGAETKNGYILYFVRDNGMGIDPRYRDKLFSLFEKLNSGLEGTGIGLYLVKRMIEVHGGKIWAESEGIGKGTCFWFSLPGK